MPASTDITGLAGIAVALAAALLALPTVRGLTGPRLAVLLTAVVVLVLAPLGALPVAACVRGAIGDLSITTLVLLATAILRGVTGWPPADQRARCSLLGCISTAALFLYPMALGVGLFDPYRLGYGSPWLLGTLFAVALAAWFRRFDSIAICIALATLAWTVRWYESNNLWDYLLDPFVSFYALGVFTGRGANRILRSIRSSRREAAPVDFMSRR